MLPGAHSSVRLVPQAATGEIKRFGFGVFYDNKGSIQCALVRTVLNPLEMRFAIEQREHSEFFAEYDFRRIVINIFQALLYVLRGGKRSGHTG